MSLFGDIVPRDRLPQETVCSGGLRYPQAVDLHIREGIRFLELLVCSKVRNETTHIALRHPLELPDDRVHRCRLARTGDTRNICVGVSLCVPIESKTTYRHNHRFPPPAGRSRNTRPFQIPPRGRAGHPACSRRAEHASRGATGRGEGGPWNNRSRGSRCSTARRASRAFGVRRTPRLESVERGRLWSVGSDARFFARVFAWMGFWARRYRCRCTPPLPPTRNHRFYHR